MKKGKYMGILWILIVVKVGASVLTHSYTLGMNTLYEFFLLFCLSMSSKKENSNGKKVLISSLSFLYLLGGLGLFLSCMLQSPKKISLFLIPILVFHLLAKYCITCLQINKTHAKKEGVLSYATTTSNYDFFSFFFLLAVSIISTCSRFYKPLLQIDRIGTFILLLFLAYRVIRSISTSFKEQEEKLFTEQLEEISSRQEIQKVENIQISYTGGISCIHSTISLKKEVNMLGVNTFLLTLSDYLLKYADVVKIYECPISNRRSKRGQENARNSRSRNSKTNVKGKNTKQKNKKR